MASSRIELGDVVPLTHTFLVGATPTNPTTVTVTVTDPAGTTSTPTASTAATGIYTASFTPTVAGLHTVRWVGAGAVVDAKDDAFRVFESADATLYAGLDELGTALGMSTGTADDESLQVALDAACRAIDKFTGRRFYRQAAATRYATAGASRRTVPTPDLVSVSAVTLDAGTGTFATAVTEGTHYYLAPRAANDQDAPYTALEGLGAYLFPGGPERVKITGTFGWPTVPAEVSQAAIMQATRIWKRAREAPFGIAGLTLDGGGVRLLARLDSEVEVLLRPFQRVMVG